MQVMGKFVQVSGSHVAFGVPVHGTTFELELGGYPVFIDFQPSSIATTNWVEATQTIILNGFDDAGWLSAGVTINNAAGNFFVSIMSFVQMNGTTACTRSVIFTIV